MRKDASIPSEIGNLLSWLVREFRGILKANLVGVYLHGSLAMGCFNPKLSDVDFIVVVERKLSVDEKKEIVRKILKISESVDVPKKGLEFSVVLLKYTKNFVYPTPFELHFSKDWKSAYEKGEIDYTKENRDPDLASHFTVIRERGIVLWGKPIDEVFGYVDEKYYLSSLLEDVRSSLDSLHDDSVYFILNFCRVLQYMSEKKVSSKKEGALWAMKNLDEFTDVIKNALDYYTGKSDSFNVEKERIEGFREYMLERIEREVGV